MYFNALSLLTTFQTPAVSCTGHFNCFHTHVSARLRTVYGWKSKLCTHQPALTNSYFFFFYLFIYLLWLVTHNAVEWKQAPWHQEHLPVMVTLFIHYAAGVRGLQGQRGSRALTVCHPENFCYLDVETPCHSLLLVLGLLLGIGCLELFF